jgi:hypothetical protein
VISWFQAFALQMQLVPLHVGNGTNATAPATAPAAAERRRLLWEQQTNIKWENHNRNRHDGGGRNSNSDSAAASDSDFFHHALPDPGDPHLHQDLQPPLLELPGRTDGGASHGASFAYGAGLVGGLYKLNPVDPQLETAWFQPSNL